MRPIWAGSYFMTMMMSEPTDWSCPMNDLLRPWMTETMPMTVMTPMMMPRTVRKERSLCVRRESMAMPKISRTMLDPHCSDLRASTGSSLAARLAG